MTKYEFEVCPYFGSLWNFPEFISLALNVSGLQFRSEFVSKRQTFFTDTFRLQIVNSESIWGPDGIENVFEFRFASSTESLGFPVRGKEEADGGVIHMKDYKVEWVPASYKSFLHLIPEGFFLRMGAFEVHRTLYGDPSAHEIVIIQNQMESFGVSSLVPDFSTSYAESASSLFG